MTKLIRIKGLLFLLVCALFSLNGCGGGGGSGSSPSTPTTPVVSNTVALELGIPVKSGNMVTFPLNFTNPNGYPISGIEANIGFDSKAFTVIMNGSNPVSATPGGATVLAGKTISQSKSPTQSGVLRLIIIDLSGGTKSISSGVVAQISFSILPGAPPGSYTYSLEVIKATDSTGAAKTLEVINPTISFTL